MDNNQSHKQKHKKPKGDHPRKRTYKSFAKIAFFAWTLAASFFNFGYFLVFLTQIPVSTLRDLYNIALGDGLTIGILNGAFPVGGLVGALTSSCVIGRFSRRQNVIGINVLCFAACWLIFIKKFPMLLICRFLQGVSMGALGSIIPMMIKQLSPIEISGALGAFSSLNISIGVFFGCLVSYILIKITGDVSGYSYWFIIFGVPQAVVLVQTLLLLFVFPYQTPKYWLSVGNEQEAINLIAIIYKSQFVDAVLAQKKFDIKKEEKNLTETNTIEDLAEFAPNVTLQSIIFQQKLDQNKQLAHQKEIIAQTLTHPTDIKDRQKPKEQGMCFQLVISLFLGALQQLSGINFVATYADSLSKEFFTGELSYAMPSIINFIIIPAILASYFLLHSVGRRPILFYGTLVAGISNLIIAIAFQIQDSDRTTSTILLFVGFILFMIDFGLSLGPVVYLYIPEIIGPHLISFAVISTWVGAALPIILFPIIVKNSLNGNPGLLFVINAAICLLSLIPIYFFVVETKDKTQKRIRNDYKQVKTCQKRHKKK